MKWAYAISILSFFLFLSCKREVIIPSYISISNASLSSQYNTQGTSSHSINSAWVFINGQTLGAFELPAKIPFIGHGKQKIKIIAGIKANGIQSQSVIYPFYDAFEKEITLTPDSITFIQPQFIYNSTTTFWKEDFEINPIQIVSLEDSTPIHINQVTPFFLQNELSIKSAHSSLTSINETKIFGTINNFSVQDMGESVFLEINYACNSTFYVGIVQRLGDINLLKTHVGINPSYAHETVTWKKIYIDLSQLIQSFGNEAEFDLFFKLTGENSNSDTPSFFLDNVKLVYSP